MKPHSVLGAACGRDQQGSDPSRPESYPCPVTRALRVYEWGLEPEAQPGQRQGLQSCPTLEQTGHTSLDLYWPWNRSTMKESFLILCRCQASSATTCREKGLSAALNHRGRGCRAAPSAPRCIFTSSGLPSESTVSV